MWQQLFGSLCISFARWHLTAVGCVVIIHHTLKVVFTCQVGILLLYLLYIYLV